MEEKKILNVTDALDYMGIDYADDVVKRNVERCIKTADAFLKGGIGANYPKDDPRAQELALVIVDDLYNNRTYTTTGSVSNNVRRLVEDLSLQLRVELSEVGGNG